MKRKATMASGLAIWALGMVFFTVAVGGENGGGVASATAPTNINCGFPAIFNFGDSNSDTGTSSAVFGEFLPPFGVTVGKKFKRVCDGRLIIDFLAEKLGLPYLNATVDSIGTSYKHGANFAASGAKIGSGPMPGYMPFNLDVQISQFLRFKSRTTALYNKLTNTTSDNPLFKSILPEPQVFSKALYTIDIGQNDHQFNFEFKPIPDILDKFYTAVQRLLRDGAKFMWIHNTGPFGCLPAQIEGDHTKCMTPGSGCALDENGCLIQKNIVAQEFNKELKDRVFKLRAQFPDAVITLVDMYSAKYSLFRVPNSQGFEEPLLKQCCGNYTMWCGTRKPDVALENPELGKPQATVCKNPSKRISWDGVHYTQAANKVLANLIANGSFSDPPIPITQACHKP